MEIDQDLYSRQIYVLGDQAMNKLATANILLVNCGSLGIEIAKNIVLAGVKSLTIMDDTVSTNIDLGTQFFIQPEHVKNGVTRAAASFESLKELNPYVKIEILKKNLNKDFPSNPNDIYELIKNFNCVILTETYLETAVAINDYCRKNKIMFLMSDVYGLAGWSFTDFGDTFTVSDFNGEELKEQFIGGISKSDKPIVETLEARLHNLESGDHVKLIEIEGMTQLNEKIFQVSVISPTKFYLDNCDTTNYDNYIRGGIFKQVKQSKEFNFKSLNNQIHEPDVIVSNFAKLLQPYYVHVGLLTLSATQKNATLNEFLANVAQHLTELNSKNSNLNLDGASKDVIDMFKIMYLSHKGKFPPLSAIFGGIVAQEALKSILGKFTPIKQWLHLDFVDLYEPQVDLDTLDVQSLIKNDRYDSLRLCFGGEKTLEKLKNSKLFMVGCGAIGCEMLKNYALLGVACNSGLITITDNDIIEKSNLNRQFLFRPGDIRKAKSVTAAEATRKINPDVRIKTYQEKVCPQTENDIFTDKFFQMQDVCVNALDNVEARRYMDSRCVTNQKPLLESGTLGSKGHVQVIIPHLTESYTTQRDPQDQDIPYCTLKSFPANIEHCIQWARDKFESSFTIKPSVFRKFFYENKNLEQLLNSLKNEPNLVIEGSVQIAKIMRDFCFDWNDCLKLARIKFEKYFSNKAKNLLHAYPLDHLLEDSTPFWKLPRRVPRAIKFDIKDELHVKFVLSCARLYADVYGVKVGDHENVGILTEFENLVPEWRPSGKKIEIDENKKKEDLEKVDSKASGGDYENTRCAELIEIIIKKTNNFNANLGILNFEKDDDLNGHIDFIYAASNLRATMYSIENSNRLHVKKIAGKIVPAIATTTSCISGFVSAELIKVIRNEANIEKYNNLFLNLALSLYLLSEPGACAKTRIVGDCYVTLWDKWLINGRKDMLLREFIDQIKKKYSLTVSGVIYGTKSIYIPVMPGHAKRLNETMLKLIKGPNAATMNLNENDYADLALTYAECDETDNGNANNLCPPVRYYFFSN